MEKKGQTVDEHATWPTPLLVGRDACALRKGHRSDTMVCARCRRCEMVRRTQGEGSVYMRKDGRAAASIMYEGKRITKYGSL